jgi:hypothetical protein
MTKVATVKKTEAIIDQTKAKMAQTSSEYIPVVKEEDAWTIRPAAMPNTMEEAVATVKEIIGGQTEKDIPHCQHGEMGWKTGTSKAGKPWGHFKCTSTRIDQCKDPIWYEIAQDGTWQRQKARV